MAKPWYDVSCLSGTIVFLTLIIQPESSSKLSSEQAAGIGPFHLQNCHLLRSLVFTYLTPRGNIQGFASALGRTIDSLAPGLCLGVLEMNFQTSTSGDLIPLLTSSMWDHLESVFRSRQPFRKIRVRLASDGRLSPRRRECMKLVDDSLLANALDAPARLPCLLQAHAIDIRINSDALPITILFP